jgi:hypothetical protein
MPEDRPVSNRCLTVSASVTRQAQEEKKLGSLAF